jgi:predicted Rossmann fold nucleotide-binding protein DprA/Smf involved in DNA uptake
LLLTSYFFKAGNSDAKPLTIKEWGKFAFWLKNNSVSPADLLSSEVKLLLSDWHDARIGTERIMQLLNRGHSLALAVEKWQRAGLWIVTRSDSEYPKRLKKRLGTDSPPVLFGCGNKALLDSGGLAVIGSRNANDFDLSFTDQAAAKAASEGIAIVSGGARGVDEVAMLGAMQRGGPVIGVMADSLLKAATSAKWRKGLMEGNAVLVSPFYPEAGFNAGNAMARNKYIYCLADSSLVIHSGKKGGTLNGAEENLKKGWVPLWVKPTNDLGAANVDLVSKGGRWCTEDIKSLQVADLLLVERYTSKAIKQKKIEFLPLPTQPELFAGSMIEFETTENNGKSDSSAEKSLDYIPLELSIEIDENRKQTIDFYCLFVAELQRLALSPITLDALMESTSLHKSQLNDWLKRATSDGVIKKISRPVRYQVIVVE